MASKKAFTQWPVLAALAVVFVVTYIVGRAESSPIAQATQWISNRLEGFAPAPILDTPQCPVGYRFFNDSHGESFCCKGEINRYTHKCLAQGVNELCAMKPGMANPRNPGSVLPLCGNLIKKTAVVTAQKTCPGSLPNFASIGKCCASGVDLDGRDCNAMDNKDTRRYCVIDGPLKAGEQRCSALKMNEDASCPIGLNKVTYALGTREQTKYGASAKGQSIPVCFGMDNTCIPDNVIKTMQDKGVYGDKKDLTKWLYACSGWERKNIKKDLTVKYDDKYLS